MTKIHYLLLVMAVMTACHTIDPEPDPEPEPEPAPAYAQILSRYESILDYTPWPAQTRADDNLAGPGGNFTYWWEHRTEVNSAQALWDLCRLTDQQLATMSTRNLARTVYMYPYGFEFQSLSLNTYVGILVEMGRFNGTRELMSRASGAAELLRLYQEVHYPAHAPVGTFTELDYSEYLGDNTAYRAMPYLSFLLITAVDYGRFQREEVSVLARAIAEKIEEILTIVNNGGTELYSWPGNIRFPYVLGAFVAYHHDASLTDKERRDLLAFVDYASNPTLDSPGMPYLLDTETNIYVLDKELVSEATRIVAQSLARLY